MQRLFFYCDAGAIRHFCRIAATTVLLTCCLSSHAGPTTATPKKPAAARTNAQPKTPDSASMTPAPKIGPMEKRLIGAWKTDVQLTCGDRLGIRLEFRPDHSFTGFVAVDGRQIVDGKGTWTLDASTLYYTYLHSRERVPEELQTQTDKILAIDGNTMTIKSETFEGDVTFSRILPESNSEPVENPRTYERHDRERP